ncbi:phosphotransferase [Aliiglaciecola sp. LCG003]|uniref:phosphotransferase n=1 Tax=Aliiglaciecola sp. LCG003 TaxID=3053655 RepID=UPI002572BA2D|nr:phosphotransferase [Aliiglaciecola sp. LCG003]WJG08338.1 phosphotransferase [Aliiglaciecola sp. LCG003]
MKQAKIIDELIASQLFGLHLSMEPITGGTVNQSYRLYDGETIYFLKTFELNHIAPTDRQALFYQQAQLADLGRATKPVYLSKAHDFQVELWFEHVSLSKATIDTQQKIICLAKVLFDIHHLPTVATSLDLPKDWLLYLDAAGRQNLAYWMERIELCKADWIDTHKVDQVLCHNDLAMEHIAMAEVPVIFDWEYAALGNRYFDLAACALINRLDHSEILSLQTHYAHLSGLEPQWVFEQCQRQFPIVKLTNDLWYLAAAEVNKAQSV